MKNFLLFILCLNLLLFSCEKDAGEGGTSAISGKVYKLATFQNSSTGNIDTLYFHEDAKKDVYIIYSNNEDDVYDDSFETNWNGEYRFEYLRKGEYIVFTYADSTDANSIQYDYPVFQYIKIENNNQTYSLPDFIIHQ